MAALQTIFIVADAAHVDNYTSPRWSVLTNARRETQYP